MVLIEHMLKREVEIVRECQPGISLLAAGLLAMGALSVISRDFAYTWQPVPVFPGRDVAAVVCGLFMIAAGAGLLFRATAAVAVRALFPFLLVWMCLKIPALIAMPRIEGVWLVVHGHVSVPVDVEHGRAVLDLQP